MNSEQILIKLKKDGHRFTKIRKSILDLLIKEPKPFSPLQLQKILLKNKISANKTTIYRELSFLKDQNVVVELQFKDNVKRYEIITEKHHHHIVCLNCDRVEDVELKKDLQREEKNIAKNKRFKIINHSLEFYGVCNNCA